MKIKDYSNQTIVGVGDKIIGSDGTTGETKNFLVTDLIDLIDLYAPLPYTILSGTIYQGTTSAPTLTIFQNTLGYTPTMSYLSTGSYKFTFSDPILTSKTWLSISRRQAGYPDFYRISTTELQLDTYNNSNTLANSLLGSNSFEIRIYA